MPSRTCLGCRAVADQSVLVRIAAVDGAAVLDEARRLPGRGAWLHPDDACLATALKRRAVPRALRCEVDVAALPEQLARWQAVRG